MGVYSCVRHGSSWADKWRSVSPWHPGAELPSPVPRRATPLLLRSRYAAALYARETRRVRIRVRIRVRYLRDANRPGRAVQIVSIKTRVKPAPGWCPRLKLKFDEELF